jgi:hypothetical protein
MWVGGEGIVRAFFAEVVMTWNVEQGQALSSRGSLGLSLDAELNAQREAQELLASLGDVPCVQAGRVAEGGGVWVYPNDEYVLNEDEDPYHTNHVCVGWVEALDRIKTYVALFNAGPVDAA